MDRHAELSEYIRLERTHFIIPDMAPYYKFRQDADSQVVLHHGKNGEIIVGCIFDVRTDFIFFQDLMNIACVSVLADDEWSVLEPFQGNLVILGPGMPLGEDCHHLIVMDRYEVRSLAFLETGKPYVHLIV